jgi:mono/diheme cytochrome c family protein
MRGTSLIIGAVGCALFAIGALVPGNAYAADGQDLPPGPGRALVYGQCRTCHDLQYLIESAGVPRDTWNDLLDSMKQYGLRISPDQRAKILEYLGTYLGPNPPPAAATAAPGATPAKVDGAAVFADQCAICHQPKGEGVAGQFPPLAHNRDVFLARDFPVRVVLFGLKGKIAVGGHDFDSEMPPLDLLSDAEIAAVVAYVRNSWGNASLRPSNMPAIDAATVAAVRQKKLSAEQVYDDRRKLKAAAAK